MMSSNRFDHYPHYIRNEAYQQLYHENVPYTGYGTDRLYWTAFLKRCKELVNALAAPKRPSKRSGSPNVCPPQSVSDAPSTSTRTALQRLQTLGTVRCCRVAALPAGGFSLLVRLVIPGRGKVYRYGELSRRDDADALIHRWIDKGYWTSDRS